MNYKLKVTKTESNPNYKEEMAQYDADRRWSHRDSELPKTELIKDVLIVELTEEQYKKVKAEVFKVFE